MKHKDEISKVKILIPLTRGSRGLWDLFSTRGRGAMEGEERKKKPDQSGGLPPEDLGPPLGWEPRLPTKD